jgi:hypothetical protein
VVGCRLVAQLLGSGTTSPIYLAQVLGVVAEETVHWLAKSVLSGATKLHLVGMHSSRESPRRPTGTRRLSLARSFECAAAMKWR